MLFNSHIFLFGFLPLTLIGFFILGRFSHRAAAAWLATMSLAFYGWERPGLVPLILGSALFNFVIGLAILRAKPLSQVGAKLTLIFGLAANLLLLGYFKYAGFLAANINVALGTQIADPSVILPLGISFYTFTQIAYLADCYRSSTKEYDPVHYLLFVSYFPHLIAGPILHHRELMPQFSNHSIYRFDPEKLALGVTLFAIGLVKKTVLADGISVYVGPVFDHSLDHSVPFSAAWLSALAFSLQIYFDFSGYSDMAIGLSTMFGIKLPVNFWSPYKSTSIIEFWRRWHMTLSRFLRDYLYIPLGGNRHGSIQRYINLMITMLLGGLWHGASWTFVVWGGLHGLYLVINHGWRHLWEKDGRSSSAGSIPKPLGISITYIAVVIAWVVFRAKDVASAFHIIFGMLGGNAVADVLSRASFLEHWGPLGHILHRWSQQNLPAASAWDVVPWLSVAALSAIVWFAPNALEILRNYELALGRPEMVTSRPLVLRWALSWPWLIYTALALSLSFLSLSKTSQFLYYQF